MKISRFNLKILEQEVDALEQLFPDLRKTIKEWTGVQNDRDVWGSTDQEWAKIKRNHLEEELTKFREKLALIYDFMGDRGLAEFIPTRIRNERAGLIVMEPEIGNLEVDPIPNGFQGIGIATEQHVIDGVPEPGGLPPVRQIEDMVVYYGEDDDT